MVASITFISLLVYERSPNLMAFGQLWFKVYSCRDELDGVKTNILVSFLYDEARAIPLCNVKTESIHVFITLNNPKLSYQVTDISSQFTFLANLYSTLEPNTFSSSTVNVGNLQSFKANKDFLGWLAFFRKSLKMCEISQKKFV